jgi:hypothetical protein
MGIRSDLYSRAIYTMINYTNIYKETLSKIKLKRKLGNWSLGVVVITFALHAKGPEFDPQSDHKVFFLGENLGYYYYYIFF